MGWVSHRRAAVAAHLLVIAGLLLLALPVSAQVEDEAPPLATVEEGCIPFGESQADVVVTVAQGHRVYLIDSDNFILPVEAPGATVQLIAGDYTWIAYDTTDRDKTPLVGGEFTIEPCPPGDADVTVEFGCTEGDTYGVVYSTSNATISWMVAGQSASVSSGQTFDPGTEVSWTALADDGFEFAADEPDAEGSFTAERCTTPTSRSNPGTASASVIGLCVTDPSTGVGTASLVIRVSPTGGATVDIPGVGTFDADAIVDGLPDETTYTYTVSPKGDRRLSTPTSGSVVVADCDVEVLGTVVTTTIPAVSVDTLPFTGPQNERAALLGGLVLAAGLGLLALGRRQESGQATQRPAASWRNH